MSAIEIHVTNGTVPVAEAQALLAEVERLVAETQRLTREREEAMQELTERRESGGKGVEIILRQRGEINALRAAGQQMADRADHYGECYFCSAETCRNVAHRADCPVAAWARLTTKEPT